MLILNRTKQDVSSTLGELSINGSSPLFTLERGEFGDHCRIPAGTYALKLKPIGTSHWDKPAIEFMGVLHQGMIEIQGVSGRSEILMHWGNYPKDTLGCALVGSAWDHSLIPVQNIICYWIKSSKETYKKFYPIVASLIKAGPTSIAVVDQFKEGV